MTNLSIFLIYFKYILKLSIFQLHTLLRMFHNNIFLKKRLNNYYE